MKLNFIGFMDNAYMNTNSSSWIGCFVPYGAQLNVLRGVCVPFSVR